MLLWHLEKFIYEWIITFKANMPNKEDPLSARSFAAGTSADTFVMNNPYKPMPNINITVPARYTSGLRRIQHLIRQDTEYWYIWKYRFWDNLVCTCNVLRRSQEPVWFHLNFTFPTFSGRIDFLVSCENGIMLGLYIYYIFLRRQYMYANESVLVLWCLLIGIA